MRPLSLLIAVSLFVISIQASASNIRKAPYPNPAIPTQTAAAAFESFKSAPAIPTAVPTNTPTPAALQSVQGVTVWPTTSKGGQAIFFKAPFDPGTTIQLSIQSLSGEQVFQTAFSKTGRGGGYVWRLQDRSDSPVASGIYVYDLRFKQQGQNVTAQGKVTVTR